jgi:hypothetical protein
VSCNRDFGLFSPMDSVYVDAEVSVAENAARALSTVTVSLREGVEVLFGGGISGMVYLRMVDAAGRCVWRGEQERQAGAAARLVLPCTGALSPGVYLLSVGWNTARRCAERSQREGRHSVS